MEADTNLQLPAGSNETYLNLKNNINDTEALNFAINSGVNNFYFFINGIDAENKIPKCKPWELSSELNGLVDEKHICKVVFTKSGSILIQVNTSEAALAISRINKLLGVNVKPSLILSNCSTKILIRNVSEDIPLNKLVEDIALKNGLTILEARRFTRKNPVKLTRTVLLTILGHKVPDKIKIWYNIFHCEIFFDKPRQCANCWSFGHIKKFCKSASLCEKCGSKVSDPSHSKMCEIKCKNCGGNHLVSDKECPYYEKEQEIINYSVQNHIPIREAKRLYKIEDNKTKSFSAILKSGSPECVSNNHFDQKINELAISFQNMFAYLLKKIETLFEKINGAENLKVSDNNDCKHKRKYCKISTPIKSPDPSDAYLSIESDEEEMAEGATVLDNAESSPLEMPSINSLIDFQNNIAENVKNNKRNSGFAKKIPKKSKRSKNPFKAKA